MEMIEVIRNHFLKWLEHQKMANGNVQFDGKINLPNGTVFVVFGDTILNQKKYYGEFIHKKQLPINPKELDWDGRIIISEKACSLYGSYPSFFTYIYGHELGHAHIAFSDFQLYIHCVLTQDFIKEASNRGIKWHELPHEKYCDKIGIYIASKIFSKKTLNKEIKKLIKKKNIMDNDRLEFILSTEGSLNYDNLRNDLIEYSLPYKDQLIELWENDKKQKQERSLVQYYFDLELLFK